LIKQPVEIKRRGWVLREENLKRAAINAQLVKLREEWSFVTWAPLKKDWSSYSSVERLGAFRERRQLHSCIALEPCDHDHVVSRLTRDKGRCWCGKEDVRLPVAFANCEGVFSRDWKNDL
jgi:hypothetical protein